MTRSPRLLIAFAGLATIVLLGWGLFFRSGAPGETPVQQRFASTSEELDFFLADKMDYRLSFSRMLARRRIARAREIASAEPAVAAKAAVVVDSLDARLRRSPAR